MEANRVVGYAENNTTSGPTRGVFCTEETGRFGVIRQMDNTRDIELAREVKNRLGGKIPLRDVRLFGSRARGDASPDSDLDLYLETRPLSRQERQIISDIAWEVGFENDVVIVPVVFSQDSVDRGPLSASPLYRTIQKEGIPV